MKMKKIIIAPNAFKNSISAVSAAKAIKRGLKKSRLKGEFIMLPIGDGGDGTRRLIHDHLKGQWVPREVTGPLGETIQSGFSLIEDSKTAVIEMAEASGVKLLRPEDRAPLRTNSTGTGELIKFALDREVARIVLGVGGSATVDGGCGILHALGVRFKDSRGIELAPIPQALIDLKAIDYSGLDPRLKQVKLEILCDVKNPLLGRSGAAAVFGPQKGASPSNVEFLERFLAKWCFLIKQEFDKDVSRIKHGGAAGGIAAGLYGVLNADLVDGITAFLDLVHFREILSDADYVITGEGSLDEQTLEGKGPMGVALLAKEYQIPCIGLAGKIPENSLSALNSVFTALVPIHLGNLPLAEALRNTERDLEQTAQKIGDIWSEE